MLFLAKCSKFKGFSVAMSDDKSGAKEAPMKDIIDALVARFGSLRKASRVLKIDHQLLSAWRKHSEKQKQFIERLETARAALEIPKAKYWDVLTKDL